MKEKSREDTRKRREGTIRDGEDEKKREGERTEEKKSKEKER